MKKYILFIFILFATVIKAQYTFNNSYVLPTGSDYSNAYSIIATDSGYLCIGVNKENNPQNINLFFLDLSGNADSYQSYGYSGVSCVMSPESYICYDDKVFLFFLQKDFNYSPMMRRITIYRFTGIDTTSSDIIYNDTMDCSVTSVTKGEDYYYLSGWFTPDPNNMDNANYWLVKTDSSGNIIWTKQYGGNQNDVSLQVLYTSDQSILMSGYSHSFGNNSPYDNGQWYLVKVDTAGNVLWAKTYGNPNLRDYDTHGLTETRDSCYLVSGSYAVGMSGSAELLRGRILKIDRNGNILWSKLYGKPSIFTYTSLIKEKDGGDIISIYNDGWNSGYQTSTNPVIQCLTSTGEIKWFRRYYFNQDIYSDASVLNSFDFTADGGYIFAGYGMDYDSVPAQRSWVIKTDSLGFDGVTDFSADTAYRVELAADTCYGDTAVVVAHLYGVTAPYAVTYAGYGIHDSLYYSPMYEPYIADTLFLTSAMLTTGDSILQIPVTVTDGLGRVLYDTLQADVGCLLSGTANTTYNGDILTVYPNPAKDKLLIEYVNVSGSQEQTIGLYDMEGHLLKQVKTGKVIGVAEMDVSGLPQGTYIIKSGNFTKQISVIH